MNETIFLSHILAILGAVYLFSHFKQVGLNIIFVVQILFANLFILKQIPLFGLVVTTTDCYTIGSFLALNMIRECYGKEAANQTILLGLITMIFLPFMSLFLLSYAPSAENLSMSTLYAQLLTPSYKIFFTSIICMVTFQKLDTIVFSRLRKTLSLSSAMFISLMISQAFDTFCFTFIALPGLLNNLGHIFIFSYFMKIITICIMTPATKLLIRRAA
ncbi:MAG: queuosine precursor transporter [Chlamydiia bacterium]|nr:queuosine precursor transporter [Chlamydiia bacterium]